MSPSHSTTISLSLLHKAEFHLHPRLPSASAPAVGCTAWRRRSEAPRNEKHFSVICCFRAHLHSNSCALYCQQDAGMFGCCRVRCLFCHVDLAHSYADDSRPERRRLRHAVRGFRTILFLRALSNISYTPKVLVDQLSGLSRSIAEHVAATPPCTPVPFLSVHLH